MAFFLILSVIISTLIFYIVVIHCRRTHKKMNTPPGSYGLPLIGETLQLISAYKTSSPEPFIDDRVKKHGKVFTTHVFGEPTVFSADPEVNRFVLQNEGVLFESSYPSSICNLLGKNSLLLMKGMLHKRMHSLVIKFGNCGIIRDTLLVDIDRLIRVKLDEWNGRILLQEEAKKITFDLMVKQLMSYDPGERSENLRKHYLLVIDAFFTLPIPFFFTTYGKAMKARAKVADALMAVVKERRKEYESRDVHNAKDKVTKKDMLEALLEDGGSGGGGGGFSNDEIVDFLLALLVAGYETTSTVMTIAVKFLNETPLALTQLKEEHDQIKSKKEDPETLLWSDYKSMPFTQCVINETLRVANIISGVFRKITVDVDINGYTIPKGWKIFSSFRAVHLNQDYYKEARTFNPWRWQNKSVLPPSSSSQNLFTPFGGGQRICPGYELARVQLSVFLHHFVTRLSCEPAEEDKLVFFPTTRMQNRYPIIVRRRKSF